MISFTINLGSFFYLGKLLVMSKQLSTSKAIFSLDASLTWICIHFVFVQTHFRSAFNYWMGFTNQKCKDKHTAFLIICELPFKNCQEIMLLEAVLV